MEESNSKLNIFLLKLRDGIASDLDVCTHYCDLSSLLLSCQVDVSKLLQRHSLLLKGLSMDRNIEKDLKVDRAWCRYGNLYPLVSKNNFTKSIWGQDKGKIKL